MDLTYTPYVKQRRFTPHVARKIQRLKDYNIAEEKAWEGTADETTYYICPHCRSGWRVLQDAQSCVMQCELEKGVYVKGRRKNSKAGENSLTITA